MSDAPDEARVSGGPAMLAAGEPTPDESDDAGPWTVHGLALASDAITFGQSRKRTLWPADVVADGVDALRGAPVVRGHPEDPGPEDALGEVTDARFIDGKGLAYEAEIDDAEIARQVERGRVDASPYLYRKLAEGDETDTHEATEILGVRDLGIVLDGAGDGTEIQAGAAPTPDSQTAEALSAAFSSERDSTMSNQPDRDTVEALESEVEALQEENEQLREENESARTMYAEALADHSPFDTETLTERFELSELRDRVEDTDGATVEPEVSPRTSGGSSDDGEAAEALSAADEERVEALQQRRRLFADRDGMSGYVEEIDEEIADLTGDN